MYQNKDQKQKLFFNKKLFLNLFLGGMTALLLLLKLPAPAFADKRETPLGNLEAFPALQKLLEGLKPEDVNTPIEIVNKVVTSLIGLATAGAFLYFMVQFFTAAFSWLSAGGDAKRVESAGKQISNAFIGLIIVVLGITVIDIISRVLGVPILNPLGFLVDIWK